MEAGKERATSMANAHFGMRQLTATTRRFGSWSCQNALSDATSVLTMCGPLRF
jgi:hypothetical protein